MIYGLHVNEAAIADAELIHAYIAESSLEAADRVLLMLESAFESLADLPKRYPLAPEATTHRMEIRQMRVGSYRVLFWINRETVNILRVRHFAQEPFKPGELN